VRAGLIIFLSAIAVAGLVPASSLAADGDLGVTNVASEATTQDADLTYAITVQNGGPDAAADVTLTNDVPAGTTFVSLNQDSAWSCVTPAVGDTGTVACTVPTLAPGAVKLHADRPRRPRHSARRLHHRSGACGVDGVRPERRERHEHPVQPRRPRDER
jgi:uncharacterized repeat protein (TIGR01451 family)